MRGRFGYSPAWYHICRFRHNVKTRRCSTVPGKRQTHGKTGVPVSSAHAETLRSDNAETPNAQILLPYQYRRRRHYSCVLPPVAKPYQTPTPHICFLVYPCIKKQICQAQCADTITGGDCVWAFPELNFGHEITCGKTMRANNMWVHTKDYEKLSHTNALNHTLTQCWHFYASKPTRSFTITAIHTHFALNQIVSNLQ